MIFTNRCGRCERIWENCKCSVEPLSSHAMLDELLFEIEGLTDWKDVKKLKHLADKIKTVMEE